MPFSTNVFLCLLFTMTSSIFHCPNSHFTCTSCFLHNSGLSFYMFFSFTLFTNSFIHYVIMSFRLSCILEMVLSCSNDLMLCHFCQRDIKRFPVLIDLSIAFLNHLFVFAHILLFNICKIGSQFQQVFLKLLNIQRVNNSLSFKVNMTNFLTNVIYY